MLFNDIFRFLVCKVKIFKDFFFENWKNVRLEKEVVNEYLLNYLKVVRD